MTTSVSLLPVSLTADTAVAVSPDSSGTDTSGENSLFSQVFSGLLDTGSASQQQTGIPLFISLTASQQLQADGSSLPSDRQSFAMPALFNPFVSLESIDNQNVTLNPGSVDAETERRSLVIPQLMFSVNTRSLTQSNFHHTASPLPEMPVHDEPQLVDVIPTMQKITQGMTETMGKLAIKSEPLAVNKDAGLLLNNSLSQADAHGTALAQSMTTNTVSRVDTASAFSVAPQHPAWAQQVGERVQWMLGQQLQKAEIRLDPPDLGSLEVRVVVHKDQAQVSFVTPHAQVRDALESALPRLREMLGEQGLNLANVDIGQHAFAQQRQQQDNHLSNAGDGGINDEEQGWQSGQEQDVSPVTVTTNGLLDTYA